MEHFFIGDDDEVLAPVSLATTYEGIAIRWFDPWQPEYYEMNELEADYELTSISAWEKGHETEMAMDLVPDSLASNMSTYNVVSACDKSAEVKEDPTPDVNTHIVAISACEKEDQVETELVPDVISYYPSTRVAPTIESYNALISACEKSGSKVEKAVALLAEVQQRGKAEAMELIAERQQKDPEDHYYLYYDEVSTCEALISACEDNKVEKALELYDEMQQRSLIPELKAFTALIGACEKGHRFGKAMELRATMQQIGLIPDVDVYTAHSAWGKGNKVEKALELLAEVQQEDRIPRACEKGHMVEAMELIAEMQQRVPEVTTHTAVETPLYNDSAVGVRSVRFCTLCRSKPKQGLPPEVLISACEKGHKVDSEVLGAESRQRGLPPEVLISACEKCHMVEMALERFAGTAGVTWEVSTYDALIRACEMDGKFGKAMELYAEMQQRSLIPKANTYTALISACEKNHEGKKAMELRTEMQILGMSTYRISACEKKHMVAEAMEPYAYTAISACEKCHMVEKALELCVGAAGLTWEVSTYDALIRACEIDGKFEKAMELYKEMQQRSLVPETDTYIALISACAQCL